MANHSFKIITLGCKVNQYESASLRESLITLGSTEASGNEEADIIIINTCAVTRRASYQSRQAIRKAIRENPSARTAAVGCYAQVFPEELSTIEGVQLVAGNTEKGQLPAILLKEKDPGQPVVLSKNFGPDPCFDFLPVKGFLDRTRAFLKIQDGCRTFCSYCIVPFARGPLRSLDASQVVSTLSSLSKEGYREVVLTGINMGKYGVDLQNGMNLKGLLRLIGREGFPLRVRLSSIEPNEIDRELIEIMASKEWICPHFHIPLQSGDDAILKRMNRAYGGKDFSSLIEHIHKAMPLAAIGVDVMAGFPGEDHRAFQNTHALILDLPVSYLHVFPFSPRKGTPAADFREQVDQKVIKERAAKLRNLGQDKRKAFYSSCLGESFTVLIEGWQSKKEKIMKGLSDNYLPVSVPSPKLVKNRFVRVRIKGLGDNGVIGVIPAS